MKMTNNFVMTFLNKKGRLNAAEDADDVDETSSEDDNDTGNKVKKAQSSSFIPKESPCNRPLHFLEASQYLFLASNMILNPGKISITWQFEPPPPHSSMI